MSEEKSVVSPISKEQSSRSKADALLQGLDLTAKYYSLGLDQYPLHSELKQLETQAKHHAENLKRTQKKEESISEIVQDLRDVDEIINKYEWKENMLIQILLTIQKQKRWIPQHALMWISKRLGIPISVIARSEATKQSCISL